jgi:GcrA cell cycle regulator
MSETQQWTDERLETLKKLWDDGLSISQIGEKLGVSRNAIAGKVHRLGLKKRQSPISNKTAAKSTAAQKPKVEVAEPENLPLKLALRQIDWSRSRCSWPIGDPKTTAFHFCGKDVVTGKPYCNDHCFDAFTTTRDSSGS